VDYATFFRSHQHCIIKNYADEKKEKDSRTSSMLVDETEKFQTKSNCMTVKT